MFERIKCILIKEFKQIMRDRRMKIVIFISPIIQIIIFGYAANTDIQHTPIAIYDLDNTKQSREVIRRFTYSQYFDADYYINTEEEQDYLINKSAVMGVLRFNRGFGKYLEGNRTAHLQLALDGSDSNTAQIVLGYANDIMKRYSNEVLENRAQIFLKKRFEDFPRVDLRERTWFNDNLISRNYYVPGVIALIVTVMGLLLTAMAIVREKEIGTMEQLIVSPIKPYELILGKVMPFAIIAMLQVTFITAVSVLWFKVPIRGNIFLLFGATVIYMLTSVGIGLFISTISSTQQEAVMATFLFYFPASLLSGFMFPIFNMPRVIQYVIFINPLRYYLVIIRGLFLKGIGLKILWPQLLILLIMGITILAMSSLRFQKRLE